MTGKLYLVSTPIGNLQDITLRAVNILKEADVVLAEDTRVTGKLLAHLEIKKPLMSYHEHSSDKRHQEVLSMISDGKTAALCSDAGMPCISDPGQQLVKDAVDAGIEVIPIPGANAMLTALIASGVSTDRFTFMGFFPRKNKEDEIGKVIHNEATLVYYESPMRVTDTVCAIAQLIPGRQIAVARELTKLHEEFIRGTAKDVYENLSSRPSIKGEIVIVIAPEQKELDELTDEYITDLLKTHMTEGDSLKTSVAKVCDEYKLPKNRVYDIGKNIK